LSFAEAKRVEKQSFATPLWRRESPVVSWPALLDLITSTLMVFLLVAFLQIAFGQEPEAAFTRSKQESFVERFDAEFSQEIAAGEVHVARRLNFLQITFSDKVLFPSGDYRLQPAGLGLLARCAKVFMEANETGYEQIQVEGHTDDRPIWRSAYPADNWELASARAISVVRFLTGVRGLSARVFSVNGYAFYRPIAGNDTEEGRARNRRIEVRLFFSGTNSSVIGEESAPGRTIGGS
jgi:flagellar motor protein MotB